MISPLIIRTRGHRLEGIWHSGSQMGMIIHGARGMNLGIEDAFISSQLLHDNKLNEYDKLRRPYLTKIVKRINNITMGISGNSIISKIVRSQLANLRIFFPIVMPRVRDFVIGVK